MEQSRFFSRFVKEEEKRYFDSLVKYNKKEEIKKMKL
jgi:hypothetical protein